MQILLVNNFEWIEDTSQLNEDIIKNFNEESDEGYFLEVNVYYPEKLCEFHNDLPFLPARIKIEKIEKFVANLHDKTEYVIHIRNLKQELNHGLVLRKAQWLNLNKKLGMNTDLKKKAKNDFEKDFFKLMNNSVVWKQNIENVRKHRDIELIKTERRRKYLESKPNYHTTKFFTDNLLATEIKKGRYFWINRSI